jgi:phospholipase D1/2
MMDGKPYKVSTFVQSLRIGIMEDFIGMSSSEAAQRLQDPVADYTFRDLIVNRARKNTALYIDVFGVMPDNSHTMEQYRRVQVDLNAPESEGKRDILDEIEGVIVEFPLDFLKDEDLSIGFFEKEKYVPRVTFL